MTMRMRLARLVTRTIASAVYHAGPPLGWGVVVWCGWRWFVTPALGAPAIGYATAVAFGLLVRALRPRLMGIQEWDAIGALPMKDAWRWWFTWAVTMPLYSLALMLLCHWWAGR